MWLLNEAQSDYRAITTVAPLSLLWWPCYRGPCPVSRPDHRSYAHLSFARSLPTQIGCGCITYYVLTYSLLPMTAQLTQKWSGTQQLPPRNSGAWSWGLSRLVWEMFVKVCAELRTMAPADQQQTAPVRGSLLWFFIIIFRSCFCLTSNWSLRN